jgi:hypothetical protein
MSGNNDITRLPTLGECFMNMKDIFLSFFPWVVLAKGGAQVVGTDIITKFPNLPFQYHTHNYLPYLLIP